MHTQHTQQNTSPETLRSIIVEKFQGQGSEFAALCVELLNKLDQSVLGETWKITTEQDATVFGVGYYTKAGSYFKALFQAQHKAIDNNIQADEMQTFINTARTHNAVKGIFITTSDFTQGAQDLAQQRIITTVNGIQLAECLIQHLPSKASEIYQ